LDITEVIVRAKVASGAYKTFTIQYRNYPKTCSIGKLLTKYVL